MQPLISQVFSPLSTSTHHGSLRWIPFGQRRILPSVTVSTPAEDVFDLTISFDKPGVPGAGVVKAATPGVNGVGIPGVNGGGIPGVNGAGRSAVRALVRALLPPGVHSTAPTGVHAAAAPGVPGIVQIPGVTGCV